MSTTTTTITCPRCGFADSGQFCSNCGASLKREHAALGVGKVVFAPILDFLGHFREIFRPAHLAEEARAGHYNAARLFSLSAAAVLVTTLIDFVFSRPHADPLVPIPVLAELVDTIWWMVATVILLLPVHLILNYGKRTTLNAFMAVTLVITAITAPLLSFVSALFDFVLRDPAVGNLLIYAIPVFFIPAYAALYRRNLVVVAIGFAVAIGFWVALAMGVYTVFGDALFSF